MGKGTLTLLLYIICHELPLVPQVFFPQFAYFLYRCLWQTDQDCAYSPLLLSEAHKPA